MAARSGAVVFTGGVGCVVKGARVGASCGAGESAVVGGTTGAGMGMVVGTGARA